MNETQRLLQEFGRNGSDAAFQKIVRNYINLVYSVAIRRAEGDAHRAQDIVQTVFSDLARKAPGLPPDVALGGWLHRHTCFVASNVLRAESRRVRREWEAARMNLHGISPENDWSELSPYIDEAIQELPAPDRDALVMRFFERRDYRAVGSALGISDDAAQKRVTRALEKLRHSLGARGVTLSMMAFEGLLVTNSLTAAPEGWAAQVSAKALDSLPVKAAAAAGLAGLLSWVGFKTAAAMALAIAAITAGFWYPSSDREPLAEGPVVSGQGAGQLATSLAGAPNPNAGEATNAPIEENLENFSGLRLRIVSAETGEPLSSVPVDYRSWLAASRKFVGKKLTGRADGLCLVPLPEEALESLELTTRHEGYADTRLRWHPQRGQKIPDSYTLKLPRGTPIGGTVVDASGQPVAEAKVGFNDNDDPVLSTQVESPLFGWIEVETDSAGRWQMARVADSMIRRLRGGASHPEHVSSPYFEVDGDPGAERKLRDQTIIFQLGGAATVRGQVVDTSGLPIPQANVLVGTRGESGSRKAVTELDGSFEVRGCRPGETLVTADAPQYAPTTVKITLTTSAEPVQLVLARGKILKLRVVDPRGQGIAGANVWLDTFARHGPGDRTSSVTQAQFNPKTDADGRVFWDQAPDENLVFSFAAPNYMRSGDITIRPDGTEHTVVLQPALTISGTVRDAETGQSIPSFKIVTGWPNRHFGEARVTPAWSSLERFWLTFRDGKFLHRFEEPVISGFQEIEFMFKIEVEGYAPHITRVVNAQEGRATFDVALERRAALRIAVWQPDGSPAVHTEVVFAGRMEHVHLSASGFNKQGGVTFSTDEKGEVTWPPDENVVRIYAANASGFAQTSPAELRARPALHLEAWGKVEGSYTRRGRPVVGCGIGITTRDPGDREQPWLHVGSTATTDQRGRFKLDQVPPGKFKLHYSQQLEKNTFTGVPFTDVELPPGQTVSVSYDDPGVEVQVRVFLPDGAPPRDGDRLMVTMQTPSVPLPAHLQSDPAGLREWWQTAQGRAMAQRLKHFNFGTAGNGVWTSSAVPPGEYIIWAGLLSSSPNPPAPIGAEQRVIIPEDWSGEVFDLGELHLRPQSLSGAQK